MVTNPKADTIAEFNLRTQKIYCIHLGIAVNSREGWGYYAGSNGRFEQMFPNSSVFNETGLKLNSSKDKADKKLNDGRRKVVRNLLTTAGVTAGVGVVNGVDWMKPVIKTVVLPAHAETSTVAAKCCPYYFDATQNWCYDDGAAQNGNTGPVPGGFSVYNWVQPDNCPVP